MMVNLDPKSAKIFRITHIKNVPWILDHGLHCKNGSVKDPNFISIGMEDLIQRRTSRSVPLGPEGKLSDYVPFYFTPCSIMMLNIKTGYNGVTRRQNDEIAILVSSLHKLKELQVRFVFTNGHASIVETEFFDDLAELSQIDWELLRRKDFEKDPEILGRAVDTRRKRSLIATCRSMPC